MCEAESIVCSHAKLNALIPGEAACFIRNKRFHRVCPFCRQTLQLRLWQLKCTDQSISDFIKSLYALPLWDFLLFSLACFFAVIFSIFLHMDLENINLQQTLTSAPVLRHFRVTCHRTEKLLEVNLLFLYCGYLL